MLSMSKTNLPTCIVIVTYLFTGRKRKGEKKRRKRGKKTREATCPFASRVEHMKRPAASITRSRSYCFSSLARQIRTRSDAGKFDGLHFYPGRTRKVSLRGFLAFVVRGISVDFDR
ncbi:unnamed protein product [Victoria cruziana]